MYIHATNFQDAFCKCIEAIWECPDYETNSRIGEMLEIQGLTYLVEDPTTYKFEDEWIGRLDYEYANIFYNWMISGSTDAKEAFKEYPNVAQYLTKPKHPELPDNFNTFYGPRILAQLPKIIKELTDHPESRRAVISILTPNDLDLLDKGETLEFPCCDSATLSIRDNKLNLHLHMRSNNMAQVVKLDMYLWGRFQCELADKLGIKPGQFMSSIVSAHIFTKDSDYLKSINLIKE